MESNNDINMECLEDVTEFVESLWNFNVLYMANDLPDISVVECSYDYQISMLADQVFGRDTYVQTIVNNMCPETNKRCPYFRILMTGFSLKSAINYKLQAFYSRIRMGSLNARCSRAIVVGLSTLTSLEEPLSIPFCFTTTTIDPLQFTGDIDLACTKVLAQSKYPEGFTLNEIAGLCVPYYVPENVQSLILSYCREPCAQLIVDQIDKVLEKWDAVMFPMFIQREPRIPVFIASIYNASTVAKTIRDATRAFLAPSART
jgi:hypothetical protein